MQSNIFTREENINFWKNFFLIFVFFAITPITLGVSLFSLYSLHVNGLAQKNFETANLLVTPQSGVRVYASLPVKQPMIQDSIGASDARAEIVKQYLLRYDSPLVPYSDLLVTVADKYSLDFRLTTAIAQQESNLCKKIPEDSHNCWGWGIYGDKVTRFDSYEEALRRIAPQFVKIFLKGDHTKDPLEVMRTYTPPSDGSWANGVNTFFGHLE